MSAVYQNGKDFSSKEANFNDFHPEGIPRLNDSVCESERSRTTELTPYVNIYESELSNIVGRAVQAGFVETGGEAIGLLTHSGRPVIMYTTGAGPNSIQKHSLFQQDHNFVKKVSEYMFETFHLQIVGRGHSHHRIPYHGLSRQDRLGSYLLSSRNSYQKFCEFLITFEDEISSKSYLSNLRRYWGTLKTRTQKEKAKRTSNLKALNIDSGDIIDEVHQPMYVRVHAFLSWNADKGQPPIRCPIRIIPGVSPIREAIIKECPIPELKQSYNFPLSHILYDRFEAENTSDLNARQSLPRRIYNQCLQLPANVRNSSTVIHREGLTMLSLPVPGRGSIFVIFRNKKRHRVAAVYFTNHKAMNEKIALTETVLRHGPYTNVKTIYEIGVRFLSLENNMQYQVKKQL